MTSGGGYVLGNALPVPWEKHCHGLTGWLIFLRSHHMAFPNVLTKGRTAFRKSTPQDPPGDFQNTGNVSVSSATTTPQKKFQKSNDARRDMKVLAMTYILQDNPTMQEIIRLIIGLRDQYDEKVCTTCKPYT